MDIFGELLLSILHTFDVLRLLSCVYHFATPWTVACQASLSFTISQSLLKYTSIESVMLSNHLIICCFLSSCLQSFPASGSFQMSHFASGGQSIGVSASVSALPLNIQNWFPLGLTGLISLWGTVLTRDSQKVTNTDFLPIKHSLGISWLWDEGLLLTSQGTMDGKQSLNKWELVSPW